MAKTAPTQQHHTNLSNFLAILTKVTHIVAVLAPAISAPFADPDTQQLISTESGIAAGVLGELDK